MEELHQTIALVGESVDNTTFSHGGDERVMKRKLLLKASYEKPCLHFVSHVEDRANMRKNLLPSEKSKIRLLGICAKFHVTEYKHGTSFSKHLLL